ncbi:MAG: efflux transporter outer membrane subunit [Sinimarinibacterium sp.]|jgi:multidrug efflux system outer membrane protein
MRALRPVLLFATLLGGCAVGPDFVAPPTSVAPQYAASVDAGYGSDAPLLQFWQRFDDPTLAALIEQALAANHDLRIALANLNEARALLRESRLELAPSVAAQAGYAETLTSADAAPGDRDARSGALYNGSFAAIWELDLFGRLRRNLEAGHATEEARRADLHDVQISVVAEVARNYFELCGGQLELAVAQRNAGNQRQTLGLAQARLDAGSGTDFDLARAQAQLRSTLATLPAIETRIAAARNRLAVLTGRAPETADVIAVAQELAPLPRLVQVGQPEVLLRRRADIRAAEARLAAATARIGVATADLFPRVQLVGEIGFSVADLDAAGHSRGETYAFGPAISWAAFDLGRVQARIRQTEAQADGALAAYERTVLRALEETENTLTAYANARRELDHLAAGVEAGARAVALAHVRFDNGATDFLDVLDAERTQLESEARLARARTAAAASLVALYKSLGGDWSV